MNNFNFPLTRFLLGALLTTFSFSSLSQVPTQSRLVCGGKGSISERIKDCENYDSRFKGKEPSVIGIIQANVSSYRLLLYYYPYSEGLQIWAWPAGPFTHAAATKFCNDLPQGEFSNALKEFMLGDLGGKLKGFKFRLPGIDEISEISLLLKDNYRFINSGINVNEYYERVSYDFYLWTHNQQWDNDGSGRSVGVPWLVSSQFGDIQISGKNSKESARCVWSNRRELEDDANY